MGASGETPAAKPQEARPILEAVHLHKSFSAGSLFRKIRIDAVRDVSFELREGETYGLVGESGSGKSTTGRMLVGLERPDAGEVRFAGRNITALAGKERKAMRKNIQFVFQDPYSSLNPKQRIGNMLEEPLVIHRMGSASERKERVFRMLDAVGLGPDYVFRYPHELSGGQRQRLGIARAVILNPKIIVCDEPVSALDVSIQSQILNMLKRLQQDFQLTLLFISHDMSVVRYISDRIGVMYLGSLAEEAPTDELFQEPLHPYTRALLSAVPDFTRGRRRERIKLQCELSAGHDRPEGCAFQARCPLATERCRREIPAFREVKPGHKVACHLIEGEETES